MACGSACTVTQNGDGASLGAAAGAAIGNAAGVPALADTRSALADTPGTAAAGGRAAFPVAVVVGAMAATAANEASARPRASHAAAALVLGRQQRVENWRQGGLTGCTQNK